MRRPRRTIGRRHFLARLAAATAGVASTPWRGALAAGAPLFADGFDRRARRGWGRPWFNQRYGNKWGIARKKAFYDLPDAQQGAGLYNPCPVLVLDHDVATTDIRGRIAASRSSARFGLIARAGGYGSGYTAYVDGDQIKVSRLEINREIALDAASFRPGVGAGKALWIRLQVTGENPVVVKAKVWSPGRKEPRGWTVQASDLEATHEVRRRGPFGLLFLPARDGRATRFRVARVVAASPEKGSRSKPRITYAFAGRSEREPGGTYRTRLAAKADLPGEIVFHVGTNPQLSDVTVVPPAESFDKAITAKASLSGITAGSTVYWRAVAKTRSGGRARSRIRSFTAPSDGGQVAFAFGSCSHLYPVARSYLEAAQLKPSFFAHLGDLGYAHDVEGAALALRGDAYQDRWVRMLDRLGTARLHEVAAWIMQQDDHDYGTDNATRATLKEFTTGAWGQLGANFDGGLGYFDMRYGDAHCFFVDVHRYSDEQDAPDGPGHSILGAEQKQWLKDTMRASDAALLVLLTPMPFWGLGPGLLTWKEAFASEGNELKSFLFGLQSPGRRVLVCSGNAHAHYIARHQDPGGGRDLVEFVSSGTDRIRTETATAIPGDGVIDETRAIRRLDGFGLVTLQGSGAGRRVTLRAVASNPRDLGRRDIWSPLDLDL